MAIVFHFSTIYLIYEVNLKPMLYVHDYNDVTSWEPLENPYHRILIPTPFPHTYIKIMPVIHQTDRNDWLYNEY